MNKNIFDCFQAETVLQKNCLNLLGFEFDGTACFRKGAKKGPNAIRKASPGIESYSPYLNLDLNDYDGIIFDLGNLEASTKTLNVEDDWKQKNQAFEKLLSLNDSKIIDFKFLILGGEHSISYIFMKQYLEYFKNLTIIHLDAHADLRDGYEGFHYSHASIIKRISEHMTNDHQLIQYGIRSGTREEFKWMSKHKTLMTSKDKFLEKIESIPNDTPIYLTLDLDYFDPSFLAGTGTPEPGGEDFHSFISLIKILKDKNFVGSDVVELAPEIDFTGNSDVFAAKVVREISLALLYEV